MSLWGRVFASFYDRALRRTEEHGFTDMRRDLLADVHGRTVEIGAGTGLNLPLYPAAVHELVLCEPEEPMAHRLRPRAAERDAEVVLAPAERLPFPDGSVDTVVSTLVLCTVEDPTAALAEIARILAPGGRLLFLEHVRAATPARARKQDRWDPVWRRVGHGCRCNRDTLASIHASGLRVERVEHLRVPKAMEIVRPAISGAAIRPAGPPVPAVLP